MLMAARAEAGGEHICRPKTGGHELSPVGGPEVDMLAPGGGAIVCGYQYYGDFPIKNALQPVYKGGAEGILFKLGCGTPETVGDTVLAAKAASATRVAIRWKDAGDATSYKLYSDVIKSGTFATVAGTAAEGSKGTDLAWPADSLFLFRVSGVSACGEGPK